MLEVSSSRLFGLFGSPAYPLKGLPIFGVKNTQIAIDNPLSDLKFRILAMPSSTCAAQAC